MNSLFPKSIVGVFFICISLSYFAFGYGERENNNISSYQKEKILVRIGPYEITENDFTSYLKFRELELMRYPSALFPKVIESFRSKVLEEIIFQQLIFILAAEENIIYDDKEVEEVLQRGIEYLGGKGEYEKWLKENNINESYLIEQIRRKIIVDKYIEEVKKEINIPEEKIKDTYSELSKKGLTRRVTDTYDFANIFLPDFTNSPEVEAQIKNVYLKIQNGEDFFEVAKKYSKDVFSVNQGFAYYEVTLKEVLPEVKHYLVLLPVGSVSPPFRSRNGWNIIKVLGKYQKGTTIPYEKMRLGLKKELEEIELKGILNKRVEGIRRRIEIVYGDNHKMERKKCLLTK